MEKLNFKFIQEDEMTEEQKKAYDYANRCFEKNIFTIGEIFDLNKIVKNSPVIAEEEFISNYGQKFRVVCKQYGYILLDPYENKPNREQIMDAIDCAEYIWKQIAQIN